MTTTEVGYVQLRRGTTEQWAAPVSGVPHDGELIKNTTTGALKLGDGGTPEASLIPHGGRACSTDGTDGLPVPNGSGLEFVINADGLDDIRFNGVSL